MQSPLPAFICVPLRESAQSADPVRDFHQGFNDGFLRAQAAEIIGKKMFPPQIFRPFFRLPVRCLCWRFVPTGGQQLLFFVLRESNRFSDLRASANFIFERHKAVTP